MAIKRIKLEDIKNSHGSTNWIELHNKTDSEIEKETTKSTTPFSLALYIHTANK